ncbi:hypothetical protein [Dactylosporangium sp. NPDC000521]|uniref:hypothetical protein n=1 Tax=Dactylosporangium sp. NPDC000521 TaxID=3363975 RepID=UPI0036C7A8FB
MVQWWWCRVVRTASAAAWRLRPDARGIFGRTAYGFGGFGDARGSFGRMTVTGGVGVAMVVA